MKKTILIIASIIMLCNININAQVTLEHTFVTGGTSAAMGQEFFLTNLGNNNYKYVIYDYDNAKFSLYNMDYSPFMLNIEIPVISDPANNTWYRLGYITTTLFDCDSSNIEYAMMLDSPKPNKHPNFAIYRTDNTVVFSKDTCGTYFSIGLGSGSYEMHPIMNTSAGAKIFLFNTDSTHTYMNTFIYGLCGILPENIAEIHQSNEFVSVYPNPTSNNINFKITAPSNMEQYELTIFNSAFQTVKSNKINGKTNFYLDCEYFSSGVYFYSLQNKNKVFQTGKFIISK